MARIVMLYGASGSGKSASLRNFAPDEISIFNTTSKELPFKGGNKIPIINNAKYEDIAKGLSNPSKKCYVIDDCGYLLSFGALRRATEKGYDKWNELAKGFFDMIDFIINQVPNDIIIYIVMHEDVDANGQICAKTTGKMIRDTLLLEGLFTTVLHSVHTENGYKFITGGEVNSITKSPMGMFEEKEIDNDLKVVDTIIREYYGMPPLSTKAKPTAKKETK